MSSITSVIRSSLLALAVAGLVAVPTLAQVSNPQQGSVGLEGTIPTDPPTQGATISFPTNGQSFGTSPIPVRGICPAGLLVKIFKNQVFAGSVFCTPGGTFEIEIDLFSGSNALVARVFDALDQPGPDSNTVNVTFNDSNVQEGVDELILTSNFATRGADPYKTLVWPLAVSGGIGPYAVSVDWGDGVNDLSTVNFAGNFDIEHEYTQPGVYKVIVRVADTRGETAFLQLVAIANGPTSQDGVGPGGTSGAGGVDGDQPTTGLRTQFVVWPIYIMLFFAISTFWIGRRYEIRRIRYKLAHNERVEF